MYKDSVELGMHGFGSLLDHSLTTTFLGGLPLGRPQVCSRYKLGLSLGEAHVSLSCTVGGLVGPGTRKVNGWQKKFYVLKFHMPCLLAPNCH